MGSMGEPQSVAVIMSKQSKRAAAMWNWRLEMAASMPCRTAERTKQTRVGGQPRLVRRASPGFRGRTPAPGDPAGSRVRRIRRDRATRTSSAKFVAAQEVRDKTWNPRRRQVVGAAKRRTAKSSTR
jgi:hypothetical protein